MGKVVTTAAIILCAGTGSRAGGEIAKQWQPLAGKRVIDWAVKAFLDMPTIDVVVLVHSGRTIEGFVDAEDKLIFTAGGDTRAQSVRNGLAALQPYAPDYVLIHDGARPCVSSTLITRCRDALVGNAAAAPAVAVVDTLWAGQNGIVAQTVDRTHLYRAQTPQAFRYKNIVEAHSVFKGTPSDDVQVAQAAGISVAIVEGDADNIKITVPQDFARAERILRDQ